MKHSIFLAPMTANPQTHLQHLHALMAKTIIPELKRSNSCPDPSPFINNNNNNNNNHNHNHNTHNTILVKVVFPSLECTKLLRLNSQSVSYAPLMKILTIAKVIEEDKKNFRLFTESGALISNGDSLLAFKVKEKDTLIFRGKDDVKSGSFTNAQRGSPTSPRANNSNITINNNNNYSPPTPRDPNRPTSPTTVSALAVNSNGSDYWSSVSSFIGSFLKRRPTVSELPRHVFDMLDAPVPLRSSVIVSCVSYLQEKEAHLLEGIFRLSGLATEVRAVCESFKSETFDLEWVKNPHTVATALKKYCRYANPPIIPSEVCSPWVELMRSTATDNEVLSSVMHGINSLPTEHRFILVRLLSFIKLILDNQEINKMAPHNLSVVWGPNLIHIHDPTLDAFSAANLQASLMHLILTHLLLTNDDNTVSPSSLLLQLQVGVEETRLPIPTTTDG